MISSNIYQTKMRTDLGQWPCQSSFCLCGRTGGPVCRPCVAAGSCPWLERGARATGVPSSVMTFGRASLPLLAFGHFPLTGGIGLPLKGKAFGRPQGPPLRRIWKQPRLFRRGRTLAGPQMYAARPGGRALQPSTSYHLLNRARRRYEIAVAIIFANPGPRGPGGI